MRVINEVKQTLDSYNEVQHLQSVGFSEKRRKLIQRQARQPDLVGLNYDP